MLSDLAIADLARSGITPEQAEGAGWSSVDNAQDIHPRFNAAPALVIPYSHDGELIWNVDRTPFCRVRYLSVPEVHTFVKAKPQRYAQAPGTKPHGFLTPMSEPRYWQALGADPAQPVIITEGEKKALAATLRGYPTIGLGGVDSWRYPGAELIDELAEWRWNDRQVYICYDSDAVYNANVRGAEARLSHYLLDQRARVSICRLPISDEKMGLDDFLVSGGDLRGLLADADKMNSLTTEILKLNDQVAYVEAEGQVYDTDSGTFIPRDQFTNGSKYSALKLYGARNTKKKGIKDTEQSLARIWLTHPMSRRYQEVLFRPGEPVEFDVRGGRAMNLWNGWRASAGDIDPFLEFNEHLCSHLPRERVDATTTVRELPFKLMIYKAQHPEVKIPIAMVLVGEQYAGKSLWAACFREAFWPYGVELSATTFKSNFNGWSEKALIATVNETKGEDIKAAWENLKALISDTDRPMEEKYRVQRQIKTYTQYLFMANDRSVGSYDRGDRRMFIIDVPDPDGTPDSWRPTRQALVCSAWLNNGGGPALMDWMLKYPLGDWRPPSAAPLTAEKHMAHIEGRTPLQRLADELLDPERPRNFLAMAMAASNTWTTEEVNSQNVKLSSHAVKTATWLREAKLRPIYTPQEMLYIFPQIVEYLSGYKWSRTTTSGQLSRELRQAGLWFLKNLDNKKGFLYRGIREQFIVVDEFDRFRNGITQAQFDALIMEQTQ